MSLIEISIGLYDYILSHLIELFKQLAVPSVKRVLNYVSYFVPLNLFVIFGVTSYVGILLYIRQ